MAGLSIAGSQQALDAVFATSASGDYLMFSANGTSETASLGRVAVGATNWTAATSADPSVKTNVAAILSPAASGSVTVSHVAVISASSGGTQKTDWQALGASRALLTGDQLNIAAGALQITLT